MDNINPYASPQVPDAQKPIEEAGIGVWRDGDEIVLHRQAELPRYCLATGQPAEYGYCLYVSWSYPIDWTSRTLRVRVPLSDEVHRSYRARRWIPVGVFFLMVAGFALAVYYENPWAAVFCLVLTLVAGIAALFFHIRYSELLYFVKVRGDYLWLRGASWPFLDRLPEWPYGG